MSEYKDIEELIVNMRPSELIRLALRDIEAVEQLDDFDIDMGLWMKLGRRCHVCFAGAVMAHIHGFNRTDSVPSDYNDSVRPRLKSLDNFRSGLVQNGLAQFYRDAFGGEDMDTMFKALQHFKSYAHMDRLITDYSKSPEAFKGDMHKLADDLEAVGY